MRTLLIVGLGYTGTAIARAAVAAGWDVTATARDPGRVTPPDGVRLVRFADAAGAIGAATRLVMTAAPDRAAGDPALAAFGDEIRAAERLIWAGYLSTTGVYGDRGGAWVDEATPPAPSSERGLRRLSVEVAWTGLADRLAVDLVRLAGIYGPGRSALDEVRAGRLRRVDKPGHAFGRIHRDDIARMVVAAMAQERGPAVRVLNGTDDEPAPSADVITEAARLLGVTLPPPVPFAEALPGMSEMGASFWADNRRVSCTATKAALGLVWRYPTYREGLSGILTEEVGQSRGQQGEV